MTLDLGPEPRPLCLGGNVFGCTVADASLARLQTDGVDLYYSHRDDLETPLEEALGAHGKYRDGVDVDSPRAPEAAEHLDTGGREALVVLDDVAAAHGATVAAAALAWLAAQPTVVAPLTSARSPQQLAELLPALDLVLTDDELERLSALRPRG